MSTNAESKNSPAMAKVVTVGAVNLSRFVKYLSTWSGTDNFLEILQSAIRLLIPLLHLKARLQHRVGLRKNAKSAVADHIGKLVPVISDSRMLFRIWGSLPILNWLLSLSKYPPATRKLLTIERLQCYAMLVYYPMEHLVFLRGHDVIPAHISLPFLRKPVFLHPRRLIKWACRFLVVYLLLQLAHLNEDRKLLMKRQKGLTKAKGVDEEAEAEKAELKKKWLNLRFAVVSVSCRLQMGLHRALESGFFPNDLVGTLVTLTASAITFRNGWAATVVAPPPAPQQPSSAPENEEQENEEQKKNGDSE